MAWKAIEWLRNPRKSDDGALGGGQTKDAGEPWDQAISRPSGDYYGDEAEGSLGGLGSMSQREQEEIFSTYAPPKGSQSHEGTPEGA